MAADHLPARARLQPGAPASPPARLMASWQRSESYGVSLEVVEPVFSGTVDDDSLFYRCGREVLGDLQRTLVDAPVSVMLTDAEGLVLDRLSGDAGLLRALDAVHLAPGFSYAEREAGTNGLGLALADRVPTVVRAEEHYALSLCTYTCAAAPVLDPLTGRVEGAVNLTTWSRTSSEPLLLALAQSAAGNTAALMLARSRGAMSQVRPAPRGEVRRVDAPRLEPGAGTLELSSPAWTAARRRVEQALESGRVVTSVGEPGSGRATMLAQALRRLHPRARILAARAPAPHDVEAWLDLWTPELGKPHTAIIVCDVDRLPTWAAERLRDRVERARHVIAPAETGRAPDEGQAVPFAMTAERFDAVPAPLAGLVEALVQVAPLRERPDDVLPLAHHLALRVRGREVGFSAAAERALHDHVWPGNVDDVARAVRHAVTRTDHVDVAHLPPEVLSSTTHRLSRIEAFERDEIVRVVTQPGVSMQDAADELGMSRATVYRKISHYNIRVPRG